MYVQGETKHALMRKSEQVKKTQGPASLRPQLEGTPCHGGASEEGENGGKQEAGAWSKGRVDRWQGI